MRTVIILLLLAGTAEAQITQFPYLETFARAPVPGLPPGWTSTTNRSASGDFVTTTSTPHSDSVAVLSTNATVSQSLISPVFDFTACEVESLSFFERRSASHTSGVLIEASTDGGSSYSLPITDTLKNPGSTSYIRRSMGLPPSLSRNSRVRFRWRVVGNGSGTTGTIRFDDIMVTTVAQVDVAIGAVRFIPRFPVIGDSVVVEAVVRNVGLQTVQDVLVEFFEDDDGDSVAEPGEILSSSTLPQQIAAGDSALAAASIGIKGAGSHPVIVQATEAGDQNTANNMGRALLTVGVPAGSIVVNEIMYSPESPEPEWVELASTISDTLDLARWRIGDRTSRYRLDSTRFLLPPNGFVIVTKDSAAFAQRHPGVIRVAAIGSMPSSLWNNDSDAVALFDQRGAPMDSVFYRAKWGGSAGRSLERRETSLPSNDPSSWGSSVHPDSSTPGRKNSLTQKEDDLGIGEVLFSPAAPAAGEDIVIRAAVLNKGKHPAADFTIEIYEDVDGDSIPEAPEVIFSKIGSGELASGDSAVLQTGQPALAFGEHRYIVRVIYLEDEDTSNNTGFARVAAGYAPRTVVVNEIMAAPAAGEPEWIELFNTLGDPVDITGWKISNRNSSSRYSIPPAALEAAGYTVITKDTALFRSVHPTTPGTVVQAVSLPTFLFNNSGDAVVLFDARSAVMDSARYASSWGRGSGVSFERVEAGGSSTDSANWRACADSGRSTPGRQNFATPLRHNLCALRISAALSSGVTVSVLNAGREPAAAFAVSLFNDADGDSVIQESVLLARQSAGAPLEPGDSVAMFFSLGNPDPGTLNLIARIEDTLDMRASDNIAYGTIGVGAEPAALVINEIMYDPPDGQSEYLELYNRSGRSVDASGWKVNKEAIRQPSAGDRSRLTVGPSEYLVIAADSSVFRSFPYLADSSQKVVVRKGGLGLNNTGDDVVVRDVIGGIVDSVRYLPSWHNAEVEHPDGKSLERINPDLPGNDRRNWSTSAAPSGGTPGRQNSLYAVSIPSSASLAFSPNPFSPDGDGYEDVTIVSYHLPASAGLIRVRVYDSRGRLVRILADGETSGSRGEIVWDGCDDERRRVRMGIYIVLLEGLDASGVEIQAARGLVVVAARM